LLGSHPLASARSSWVFTEWSGLGVAIKQTPNSPADPTTFPSRLSFFPFFVFAVVQRSDLFPVMFSDNHLHRYWISGTKSLKIFHLFSLDVAVNVFLQFSKLRSNNEGV
jgi:hypothetical protein